MRVADSSALYALFDEDDAHHERALQALEDPEPVAVPREVLVETTDLLSCRLGKPAARSALTDLRSLPHVREAERVDLEAIVSVYLGAKGRLSLADAVVVQTCRALAADPLAFDADILAACKA